MTKSMRRCLRRLKRTERKTPSRWKPAFSATRWEAAFSDVRTELEAQHVPLCEGPGRRQPHGARGDAPVAALGAYPVADLGDAVRVVLPAHAAGAQHVAGGGVRDGERPQAAVLPAATARGDVGAGVRTRVRRGNVVDPARDLGVAAGFGDDGDVGVGPRTQGDDPVGQRWVGRAEPHVSSVVD